MNKEWVDQKNKEAKEKFEKDLAYVVNEVKHADYLKDSVKNKILKLIDDKKYFLLSMRIRSAWLLLDEDKLSENTFKEYEDKCNKLAKFAEKFTYYTEENYNSPYNKYLDMSMEFDGDIIITDPCYIMRAEHHGTVPMFEDDWGECNCGFNMEVLGIHHYMTRDTLYGDWSCSTFNTDTKDKIGSFCADAGLVSVCDLSEVLKYNPDYKYEDDWTVTYIKDFKGTVTFEVVMDSGYNTKEDEWEYNGKIYNTEGTYYENFSVEVVGHGVNKVTGEPINFLGIQTGL